MSVQRSLGPSFAREMTVSSWTIGPILDEFGLIIMGEKGESKRGVQVIIFISFYYMEF